TAGGSLVLRNANVTGVTAELTALAQHGTLAQVAGTTVAANATGAGAALDLSSAGAMTLDGAVQAVGVSTATVDLASASLTQGASGVIGTSAATATTTVNTGVLALSGSIQ